MRKPFMIIVVAALVAAIAPTTDAAGEHDCGETIKTSIVLDNSLANCAEHGLIIGANDITIDLHNKTIAGDEADGAGIFNEKGYAGVKVINGTITGFETGVLVESTKKTANIFEGLEITGNEIAVSIDGADGNHILKNEIWDNADGGVLIAGDGNLVEENELFDELPAVDVEGDENQILDNEIDYSGSEDDDASIASEGDENTIADNEIFAGGTGIDSIGDENIIDNNELEAGSGNGVVFEGEDNEVTDNEIDSYGGDGIDLVDGAGNVIAGNDIEASEGEGILVESDETRIEDNDSDDNGDSGIHVDADDSRIVGNDADDNGAYGIIADGENVEGSGNDVNGNGKAEECVPATLCD